MRARLLGVTLLLAASGAVALETTAWPPPERIERRMRELQTVIRSPESTLAQRDAARAELGALLKSPAGQARPGPPQERRAPRAAIEPFPSVVKPLPPLPAPVPPAPGVAHLEVIAPPRPPAVNPQTGSASVPSGKFAIDPATGAVLHEVPGGYVDPRTGQFIPR